VRRALSLLLAALLAVGVGTALVASVGERLGAGDPPPPTTVRGVVGSEKQPFFRDPAVVAAFAGHGLAVRVDPAGSREIAARVDLHSGLDPANLRRAIATQERRLRGRVPDDVLAAVGRVHARLREVLERSDALPPGSPDAFVVERAALDYLPTALESYLNLPRGYANRVPVSAGRSARQVLLDQLALLEAKLGEVLDAVARGDADRLVAHGRFLEDRFGRSELDIR
jgi:hypothetical protein